MKLVLVRHGETLENKKGILQGHMQGTLSEKGIYQAKQLALRLRNDKIDAIFSSDLKRAADTAREIVKYHDDIPFFLTEKLRELDWGPLTGKVKYGIDKTRSNDRIESSNSIRFRVTRLLEEIYFKYSNSSIIFSAHNGSILSLITLFLDLPPAYINKLPCQHHAALTICQSYKVGKWKIFVNNCTGHLSMEDK